MWQGELQTNVTIDAEDLLLREFLRIRTPEETDAAARWIRSQRRADGTWSNFAGGEADLSTTVEAYVALRLAGGLLGAAIVACAVIAAAYMGRLYYLYPRTDDAYVRANSVGVAPHVSGLVLVARRAESAACRPSSRRSAWRRGRWSKARRSESSATRGSRRRR